MVKAGHGESECGNGQVEVGTGCGGATSTTSSRGTRAIETGTSSGVRGFEDGPIERSVLGMGEVASVQEPERSVLGMGEVRPIDGEQQFVETVDAPAPSMEDHTPEEEATH
jgi:hypothetical protein